MVNEASAHGLAGDGREIREIGISRSGVRREGAVFVALGEYIWGQIWQDEKKSVISHVFQDMKIS